VAHKDDSLKLVWSDEPFFLYIEVTERLAQSLALQALHELRKFIVCVTYQCHVE